MELYGNLLVAKLVEFSYNVVGYSECHALSLSRFIDDNLLVIYIDNAQTRSGIAHIPQPR